MPIGRPMLHGARNICSASFVRPACCATARQHDPGADLVQDALFRDIGADDAEHFRHAQMDDVVEGGHAHGPARVADFRLKRDTLPRAASSVVAQPDSFFSRSAWPREY